MMKVEYNGKEYELNIGMYENNNTALQLIGGEGEDKEHILVTGNNGNRYPQNWVLLNDPDIVDTLSWSNAMFGDLIEEIPREDSDSKYALYCLTDEFYELVKQTLKLDEYDVVDEEKMKLLLQHMSELQEAGEKMPCPRCGHDTMNDDIHHNALSRRESIYICSSCGQDEAMLDMAEKEPLSLSKWSVSYVLR